MNGDATRMSGSAAVRNTSLLDVLAGRRPARPPVWIMRQAGRYLPEYRAVRARFPSFLDFCRTPEAAAEVTVQPVDRLDVDAAIIFSDILVLLPPMGLRVEFVEGRGPVISNPVRDGEAIRRLPRGSLNDELGFVFEALALAGRTLDGRVPLIGFAGGPFTVASYMVEGGASKELARLKGLLFSRPREAAELLETLSEVTAAYLGEQVRHGADVLTVMDSWAGFLSPEDYRAFVFPHTRALIEKVKSAHPGTPIIHYANGAAALVDHFADLGADALGLDWRSDLRQTLARFPRHTFQGNLDPSYLLTDPARIKDKVEESKRAVGGRPHVFNLGHGVLPETPVENAAAFVRAVHGDISMASP